jgi:hypothetical protein
MYNRQCNSPTLSQSTKFRQNQRMYKQSHGEGAFGGMNDDDYTCDYVKYLQ